MAALQEADLTELTSDERQRHYRKQCARAIPTSLPAHVTFDLSPSKPAKHEQWRAEENSEKGISSGGESGEDIIEDKRNEKGIREEECREDSEEGRRYRRNVQKYSSVQRRERLKKWKVQELWEEGGREEGVGDGGSREGGIREGGIREDGKMEEKEEEEGRTPRRKVQKSSSVRRRESLEERMWKALVTRLFRRNT